MSKNASSSPIGIASRPEPPYYAVIFTSRRNLRDAVGYGEMAEWMATLAARQPGYLGMESARDADGLGITVSYWQSLDDISAWRRHAEHALARGQGRADWYDAYALRISRVERAYGWERSDGLADPVEHKADA
ncbi:antibiotic biosynthesis monooxygenase [soil metagenome]